MAVVRVSLIGCAALLLAVGCSGTRSEAPQEGQEHTEATNKEQIRSPEATASEGARCDGTRTFERPYEPHEEDWLTNDAPGCPKGGLLLGTDKLDYLYGKDGDDVIRGPGGRRDDLYGGSGSDKIYGGDGNDFLWSHDGQRDKIYAGKGKDQCTIDKLDYVDSSCEKRLKLPPAPMA